MIRFTVRAADGRELARVETASTDDFYNLRDEIHATLESGEFGSRFPMFMGRFEPAEWGVDEITQLRRELETIAQGFTELPPRPRQATMATWEAIEQGRRPTLYHVYADAGGEPLLGRLIALCERAGTEARPIRME